MNPLSDIKKAMEAGPVAWRFKKVPEHKLWNYSSMDPDEPYLGNPKGWGNAGHWTVWEPLYAIDIAALLQHIEALEADAEGAKERADFLLRMTREAQDFAAMYAAEVMAWRQRFHKYSYNAEDQSIRLDRQEPKRAEAITAAMASAAQEG